MDYEGRARCINLGHCTPACAQGAKASTDITYWRGPSRRRRIAHALRCERSRQRGGMASGVIYYDKHGVEQFQAAEVVIIAATASARRGCC